jgi:CheY-like chemotaxis protein
VTGPGSPPESLIVSLTADDLSHLGRPRERGRSSFAKELQKETAFRGARAAAERRCEPPLTSPSHPAGNGNGKKLVLVVEDDPDSQIFMRLMLSKQYEVLLADSAEEARKHIRAYSAAIHAVLMDISLKGSEDGLSLTRELRSHASTERIPIIPTTAHALEDDPKRALEAGCNAYLAKPFQRQDLLALLEAS